MELANIAQNARINFFENFERDARLETACQGCARRRTCGLFDQGIEKFLNCEKNEVFESLPDVIWWRENLRDFEGWKFQEIFDRFQKTPNDPRWNRFRFTTSQMIAPDCQFRLIFMQPGGGVLKKVVSWFPQEWESFPSSGFVVGHGFENDQGEDVICFSEFWKSFLQTYAK